MPYKWLNILLYFHDTLCLFMAIISETQWARVTDNCIIKISVPLIAP